MNKTTPQLRQLKASGKKFSVIAAYDASFAAAANEAGIDAILVGDSLGMVVQGNSSTLPVSVDDMAYHTRAVASAARLSDSAALIIADMPFMSYATTQSALSNAAALMQAGANMVKLEGGAWLADTVAKLVACGIPVCAHLGLTPQSVNTLGGYKVQGKSDQQQAVLINDATLLDQAGADFVVLECVPATLAEQITQGTEFSSIGIGAGAATNAQVLVSYDILGLGNSQAKFVEVFLDPKAAAADNPIREAFAAFDRAVKNGSYPCAKHCYQ